MSPTLVVLHSVICGVTRNWTCGIVVCLQVLDMSYGAVESIDTELFKYYQNLRVLNVSHNALGTSGNSLLGTFMYLILLEEVGVCIS